MSIKTLIFVGLGAFSLFYLGVWWAARRSEAIRGVRWPAFEAIGFVTNFFDTLGIGSFATTTSLFRFFKVVDDRRIPGTLNVGHTLPTILQAFIYIAIVEVDPTTLVAMIGAAVAGAWLGAGVVSNWPVQKVRIGMGIALLVAASLFLVAQLEDRAADQAKQRLEAEAVAKGQPVDPAALAKAQSDARWLMPKGGDQLGLSGAKLAIGIVGNFILGALMSLGIGLYGPCMILVYLLGMVPTAAFPIMMGSCAFLMPTSTARFVRTGSFNGQAALGLAIGGLPAVWIAAHLVTKMPLDYVRWLVIVVVTYTAISMLYTAFSQKDQPAA